MKKHDLNHLNTVDDDLDEILSFAIGCIIGTGITLAILIFIVVVF